MIFRMNNLFMIKTIIQFILFIIFLIVFGIPSVKRYFAKSVITETEENNLNKYKLPAVTVCSR